MNTKNAIRYVIIFVIYGLMFYLFNLLYSIILIIVGTLISIFIYGIYDFQRKEKRLAIKSKIWSIIFIILMILPILAGGSSILSKKITSSAKIMFDGPSSNRVQVDTFINNFNFGENLKYNGSTPVKNFYGNYFSISDVAQELQDINSTFPIQPLGTSQKLIFNVTYNVSANSSIFFQNQIFSGGITWNISINNSVVNPNFRSFHEWWINSSYGYNMSQDFSIFNFSGILVQINYDTSSHFFVDLFQDYNIFALLDTSGNPLIVVGTLSE